MSSALSRLLTFSLICAGVVGYAHHDGGARGILSVLPIVAVVLAKPLVEFCTSLPRRVANLALQKYEGRYFEWRGKSLDIHIDSDAVCWVSTADVRKLLALPADPVLQRAYPRQCREIGDPPIWRMSTEGLSLLLDKATNPNTVKFVQWLEANVARPARNRLRRDTSRL